MTGSWTFFRRFLARDRWLLLWWIAGGVLLYYSTAVSIDGLYRTPADFQKAAETLSGNAAFVAMAGPARALDTLGGQVAWQCTAFGAILAGLMSMFIVGRHTRAEEESGREELLRAGAVGRLASTYAAIGVALAANVVMGLLVGTSLAAFGLAVADSFALGIGLTLCGWAFTGTALVAVQVTSTTRAAYGLSGAVIGAAYVLRAVGDVGDGVASWFSPIGWYQAMHAFSGLRWWPALLLVAGAGVGIGVGGLLFTRRDYGAGILPARPGPAHAGRGLRSGIGLAWRLHRGSVAGWAAGMLFVGLAYGAIGDDVGDVLGSSDAVHDVLAQGGGSLSDNFYATSILTLALICSGFAVSAALRPHTEESDGHTEIVLATAVTRLRWLGGQVAITVGGVLLVLVAAGAGLGLGYLMVTGDGSAAWRISYPALQYVAPVLVLSGVARLLYGAAPRLIVLGWLPVAFAAVVLIFGAALQLPQWLRDISPFEHLALMPAAPFSLAPFLVLLGIAAALSLAGQLAFRRRDVG